MRATFGFLDRCFHTPPKYSRDEEPHLDFWSILDDMLRRRGASAERVAWSTIPTDIEQTLVAVALVARLELQTMAPAL